MRAVIFIDYGPLSFFACYGLFRHWLCLWVAAVGKRLDGVFKHCHFAFL